jgi:electron transfer flavoprotein alpha subunit
MSVLVYAEHHNGAFKKTAYEAVTYGRKTADALGLPCVALVLGPTDKAGELGRYGAARVLQVDDAALEGFDSQVYTSAIHQAAESVGASVIVFSQTANGKALLGRLAARLDAGSVAGATAVPNTNGGFKVRKNVFSGKAIAEYELHSEKKIISVAGNSIPPEELGQPVAAEAFAAQLPAPKVKLLEVKRIEGKVPLPEAEVVVSAGRGMKGPENWGIVEDLAGILKATTACSRPVADSDWRPHHEHVGQTGIAIRPNLYVAIGISGAIQHLAGVNNSKVIVVINKDPEAPFFKAADYGVVGDLFEVVPRLTEAVKKFRAS